MTKVRSVAGVITLLSTVALAAPLAVSAAPAAPPRSAAGPAPVDGAPAQGTIVHQQPTSTVFEPPPGVIAGNAFADAVDGVDSQGNHTRTVLMSWQANEDVPAADSLRTLIRSDDGGRTFPSGHTEGISGFYRKLRTGDLLGVEFIPTRVIDGHHAELLQKRSSDGGRTWRTESSIFTTDKTINEARMNRGLRIHRDLLEDADGNLLMGYYTNNTEDSSGGSEIAISTDQGRSWQRRATVFQGAGGRTFNESAIAWARNGDLVAVVRSHLGSDLSQLHTARSTDQGRSWSSPVPLNLATASGEPAPRTGVMPVLDLLPNGVMTLSFGRPDNWIAVSPDGLGHTFEQAQTTYVNYPEQNIGTWQRWHGSSGNGAHAVVASNKIL